MSYHRLSVKPLNVALNTLLKRAVHVGLGVGAFTPILALANPTGGQVVAGQATIATPNANGLVINQASQSAIINWQQFSIGKGQYVQFLQPSSSSVVLNRVVGGNASSILGSLSANGQVFLVNPNGIFFGKSASLDVQGIVASTLGINNSDFLSGNYVFDKGTSTADASVVNQGTISTHNGGYVVLAGDYSENDGIIQARSGHVVLASGAKTTLTLSGNSLVNFAVNSATLAHLAGTDNTGSLIADGGTVVMTADVANQLKATVVNNTGLIEAHAISKNNGTITLTAIGGNLVNAGTLDADAGRMGQAGGDILLKGDAVTDLTNTSKISALGNGADGGNLEVSGRTINVRGTAALGNGGRMLLDPGTMSISTGNKNSPGVIGNTSSMGHIGVTFIESQLNTGVSVTISAAKAINHSANVHAISAVATKAATTTLALDAHAGHINLSGVNITVGGALTASFGYGNFGFIQAKSAAFTANDSTGSLRLQAATTSTNGLVTKNSVKATGGDVTITNKTNIVASDSNMIAIQATGNVNLGSAHIGNNSVAEMGVTLVGKTVTDTGSIDVGNKVNVTATAGAVTLGDVTAYNNVTVTATGGDIDAGNIITESGGHNVTLTATGGGITAGQVTAAGALTVTDTTGTVKLGDIAAYGGALTVTDTTGNMTVGGVSGADSVTLNDAGHTLNFVDNGYGRAGGNLALTAKTITQTGGSFALSAEGNVTVKGQISLASNHSSGVSHLQTVHNLRLEAGEAGAIKLDHSVAVPGAVTIGGGHLAYIGASHSFGISAAFDGNLKLDASIGSALAPVKYNVNLLDKGEAILIQKSIYTGDTVGGLAANITATETGHNPLVNVSGVLVGNSDGDLVTVSAAGNITLKGWNAAAGGHIPSINGVGQVTLKAGKNVTFSASGSYGGNGGNAAIQASNASVDEAGGYKKNTSVLVQAGGNIILKGEHVTVQAGNANVQLSVSHGYGTASANVSLVAGGNVILAGGKDSHGRVVVAGGSSVNAGINNTAFGGQTLTEKAFGNVSITAKGNIALTGQLVTVQGGWGRAHASANEGTASMTAFASADVSLKAKGSIILTGGSANGGGVQIHGGSHSTISTNSTGTHYHYFGLGQSGGAFAVGGDNLKATATTHADVSLTAGNAITLSGHAIDIEPGYGVGKTSQSNSSRAMAVHAAGSHDAASDTVTSNIALTAGAGGITLTALGAHGSVGVQGGGGLGDNASVSAAGANTKADYTVDAKVTLTTTGNITVTGPGAIYVEGGTSAARETRVAASHGVAAINDNNSLDLTAANVSIGGAGASTQVNLSGGGNAIGEASASAKNSGVATTSGLGRLDIVATGNVTLTAGKSVDIYGAYNVGSQDHVSASNSGSAAITGDAGTGITAGGTLKVTSLNGSVQVQARDGTGRSASVTAKTTGTATLTALDNVSLQGGAVRLSAVNGNVSIEAGDGVAGTGLASASNGKATLNASANVSITAAAGGIGITAKNSIYVAGGSAARGHRTSSATNAKIFSNSSNSFSSKFTHREFTDYAQAQAKGSGAVASLTGNATVSLTTTHAGAITLSQTNTASGSLSIGGGAEAAASAKALARGHGSATLAGNTGVTIKGGAVTLTGHNIDVYGAQHAAAQQSSVSFTSNHGVHSGIGFGGQSAATAYRPADPTAAFGAGAKASLTGDTSVSITGTTLAFTANGADVSLSGGYEAAQQAHAVASDGGIANVSGKSTVTLTATTAFTALAVGSHAEVHIFGGGNAAAFALASASGSGARAAVSGNAGITITAPTTILKAGEGIFVAAHNSAARGAKVFAGSFVAGGSAAVTGNADVAINAKTAFTAALSGAFAGGALVIGAASDDGSLADVAAGPEGTATLTATGDVNITAGAITLTTGKHVGASLEVVTGTRNGYQTQVHGSNGNAAATLSGGVNLAATGALTLTAGKGDIYLGSLGAIQTINLTSGGSDTVFNSDGLDKTAYAGVATASSGGKALLTANSKLSLQGATVTLTAGAYASSGTHHDIVGGVIQEINGAGDAAGASANAHGGGSAAVTANSRVSITATTGALSLTAQDINIGYLSHSSNSSRARTYRAGIGAFASASGGNAKAAVNIGGGVTLSGNTAVTLTATDGITITTASGPSHAGASAGFKGQATVTDDQHLSIVTLGTFTAKGGDDVYIWAGAGGESRNGNSSGHAALADYAHASHAGGIASFTSDGSVGINAGAVSLAAGSEVYVAGGSGAGIRGIAVASFGATANFSANRSMNITVKNAFSMTLTGKGNGGELYLAGGFDAGDGARAQVGSGGGKATLSDTANLNLTVTGTTGTITLNAGAHKGAYVDVGAGGNAGESVATYSGSHGSHFHQRYVFGASAGRGGSANATAAANINLTAKGAITLAAGASGSLYIDAGGYDAEDAQVTAFNGGKAMGNVQAATSLNGGSVTLTAGDNITVTAASNVAESAGVHGQSGGVATLNVTTGTTITAKGGLTANAGGNLRIYASGTYSSARVGASADVTASHGGAKATFTGVDTIQITAASVTLAAADSLGINGGWEVGSSAHVTAQSRKDVAVFSGDASVDITATGAISLTAGKNLFIGGGGDAADDAGAMVGAPSPGAVQATATMNVNTGVNLKAGGAFTAMAGSDIELSNGDEIGFSAHALAFGPGNVASTTVTDGINVTAATIALTAGDDVDIFVNSAAGLSGAALGIFGGKATLTATDAINLNATGAVVMTANTGDIDIRGGSGDFTHSGMQALVIGSSGGQSKVKSTSNVSITAGGNLILNAKKGNVEVSGGYGDFGSVNAVGGSASLSISAGVSLKAAKAVSITAGGGDLDIIGGGDQGLLADTFRHSSAPTGTGIVNGTLNTGVTIAAGSNVTLVAHGNVTVAAGAGETVAVGAPRLFSTGGGSTFLGNPWAGGSANLSDNLGAAVTAGKSITISAGAGKGGSGNIVVQGLGRNPDQSNGFYNNVSVRGGSSHAVANVAMTGNATLTAGSNIVLNAARVATVTGPSHKGNVSIEGGSIYNVRADLTKGNVTITGSADAGLTATHDVLFAAIGGSVNVVGLNNGSSPQGVLVEANGISGSANVTGHMDATITAGHDIATRTAAGVATVLGGGLNVYGGAGVHVVASGSAVALQNATGTANAGMTAGDVISVAGAGDLNVAGGVFNSAEAQASGSVSDARRAASVQAKSTLSGANGVTLTFTGDAVIAGGDNNAANAVTTKSVLVVHSNSTNAITASNLVAAHQNSLAAVADASATVSGKNIAITVGGNLLVRAGSGDAVKGSLYGSGNSATVSAKANVNLNAAQNLTVTVGKGTVGAASFVAGNVPTAQLYVHGGAFGSSHVPGGSHGTNHGSVSAGGNHLTGNLNTDVGVTAGGNITLNVHGNLNVTGGQAVGGSAQVLAGQPYSFGSVTKFTGNQGVATANVSGKTVFTAGGNIAITLHGGHVNLAGGYQAGTNAVIDTAVTSDGSTQAKAVLNLDESLNMTAAGAFSIVGAAANSAGVTISTQVPTTSSFGPFIFPLGSHTSVKVAGNSTVTLSGKTLHINAGKFTKSSAGTYTSAAPSGGTLNHGAITYGPYNVFIDGRIHLTSNGAPLASVVSPLTVSSRTLEFTRETLEIKPLTSGTSFGGLRSLSEMPTASPTPVVLTSDQVDITSGVLLQLDDSTLSLGTLQSMSPVLSLVAIVAPAAGDASVVQPTATLFDPALSLSAVGSSGACTALVLRQAGGYRCGAGGR